MALLMKNVFFLFCVSFFIIKLVFTSGLNFVKIKGQVYENHKSPLQIPITLPIVSLTTTDKYYHSKHWPPRTQLTAVELMVDLCNDLAFRTMHFHSILNRNNFAFSPTAMMSVLIALFEGSSSRSSTELRNVLKLPNNGDLIRVGFRDIQRKLRTYFFESENPLKGLSLNKNNITVSEKFETILMFYGYDLSEDMISQKRTSFNKTTDTSNSTTDIPSINNDTKVDMINITETENKMNETKANGIFSEEEKGQDENSTSSNEETSTTKSSAENDETTESSDGNESSNGETAELVSFNLKKDAQPVMRIQKARLTRLPKTKLNNPLTQTIPKAKYLPSMGIKAHKPSRYGRNKRSFVNFKDLHENLFSDILNSQITLYNYVPKIHDSPQSSAFIDKKYEFISQPLSNVQEKQNYDTDIISHVFYLGSDQIVHTTYKVYNAVLYHKYFDVLKMNVLELELDTKEYNLMILLPDYHIELLAAATALKWGPTLRVLRKQIRPRWVQAIIPDFKLHGTIFLTNDLQNMGIIDIFEPNRADFRPMTNESGIYIRHIEQSINVNIRTRPINQHKRDFDAQTQPIQISVNHPFLFFIIDRDLDVAVMAGRILNPLNVRIQ